jgi:hypothetical protein
MPIGSYRCLWLIREQWLLKWKITNARGVEHIISAGCWKALNLCAQRDLFLSPKKSPQRPQGTVHRYAGRVWVNAHKLEHRWALLSSETVKGFSQKVTHSHDQLYKSKCNRLWDDILHLYEKISITLSSIISLERENTVFTELELILKEKRHSLY